VDSVNLCETCGVIQSAGQERGPLSPREGVELHWQADMAVRTPIADEATFFCRLKAELHTSRFTVQWLATAS